MSSLIKNVSLLGDGRGSLCRRQEGAHGGVGWAAGAGGAASQRSGGGASGAHVGLGDRLEDLRPQLRLEAVDGAAPGEGVLQGCQAGDAVQNQRRDAPCGCWGCRAIRLPSLSCSTDAIVAVAVRADEDGAKRTRPEQCVAPPSNERGYISFRLAGWGGGDRLAGSALTASLRCAAVRGQREG